MISWHTQSGRVPDLGIRAVRLAGMAVLSLGRAPDAVLSFGSDAGHALEGPACQLGAGGSLQRDHKLSTVAKAGTADRPGQTLLG